MTANRLATETSPYLLQHQDNPVHWYPFGAEAFAAAREANQPILLSVGYAACHWCHVMAHECFEVPAIAEVMNDLFINIKVDREERPDIDAVYQQALALMGQQGGWPLTMFLTPEGVPFWGGTYFPPEPRYGRPGFPDVLRLIAEAWHQGDSKVTTNVRVMSDALANLAAARPGDAPDTPLLNRIAERLTQEIDPVHGGLAGAPKFPQPHVYEFLWRAHRRTGTAETADAVRRTLDHICLGGIYDHLGGGFARYSTDERWLVPHFEKMLYDNALLIDLLTLVWQDTHEPLYADRVAETVTWLDREMRIADDHSHAYAGTLDADSEGEEGRFYVWQANEIERLLGPDDAALFNAVYDVTATGNWEGKTILNRTGRPPHGEEARLDAMRARLLAAREGRVRPGRDDKVLTDWNGLIIAALANAGLVFERPDWIQSARNVFTFITTRLAIPDQPGRLFHAYCQGRAAHPAVLDDYANMIRATLALAEATQDSTLLDQARQWVATLDAHYAHPDGGYYFTADDAGDLISRPYGATDNATPAGNATLVAALTRLALVTGDDSYRQRAEAIVRAFGGAASESPFPFLGLLNAVDVLRRPVQITLVGDPDGADTNALLARVRAHAIPNRILFTVKPGTPLPDGHPARDKTPVAGQATAFVCIGPECSLPITDPAALDVSLSAVA